MPFIRLFGIIYIFKFLVILTFGKVVNYNCEKETKSLYIHWPFCAYKCDYCPFVSFAGKQNYISRYNSALRQEIEVFFANNFDQKIDLETVFIGGGTPSTWPQDQLLDTFGKLNSVLLFSEKTEFTIEVNPATIKEGQLEIFKKIGINRLSIGVQSLNHQVLKSLNRHHNADDVSSLLESAKSKIENVSIDLILGLPGVSFQEWKSTLGQVVNWPIKHISIYFLTLYEDTPLYDRVQKGQVNLISDDELVDQYLWSVDFLMAHGFGRYEISNFAKAGYESEHNKIYWQRKPYKGFGLSASSFDGKRRFQNTKDLVKYIEILEGVQSGSIVEYSEELDQKQVRLEKIMLGLRTDSGIDEKLLLEGLPKDQVGQLEDRISDLLDKKFIYKKDGKFVISPSFLTIENEIVLELLGN